MMEQGLLQRLATDFTSLPQVARAESGFFPSLKDKYNQCIRLDLVERFWFERNVHHYRLCSNKWRFANRMGTASQTEMPARFHKVYEKY